MLAVGMEVMGVAEADLGEAGLWLVAVLAVLVWRAGGAEAVSALKISVGRCTGRRR
jgi:hypothetical protein